MWTARWWAGLRWKSARFLILSRTRFDADLRRGRLLNFYAIINYVFNGGAGAELHVPDAAGVDPVAEKGSRRWPGFRRRGDGCVVRRRVRQCVDEVDEVFGWNFPRPGFDARH